MAILLACAIGAYVWPSIDPHWPQDGCTFGLVSNARYLELLSLSERLAVAARPNLEAKVAKFDSAGVAMLLGDQFVEIAGGLGSIQERVAAMHAVLRANGAEFRNAQPDVSDVFQDAEAKRFRAVAFQYRFDLNRFGVFRPFRRWGSIEAYFGLRDRYDEQPDQILRRNDFTFSVGIQSWLKTSGSPSRSSIHPDCPPVPTPAWEAAFKQIP